MANAALYAISPGIFPTAAANMVHDLSVKSLSPIYKRNPNGQLPDISAFAMNSKPTSRIPVNTRYKVKPEGQRPDCRASASKRTPLSPKLEHLKLNVNREGHCPDSKAFLQRRQWCLAKFDCLEIRILLPAWRFLDAPFHDFFFLISSLGLREVKQRSRPAKT